MAVVVFVAVTLCNKAYEISGVKICFSLQTTGHLCELPQGVYCIDNDGNANNPMVAIGSRNKIYLVRSEKKAS